MEENNKSVTTEEVKTKTAEQIERELQEELGVKVDYNTINPANILKFLIMSGLGIFIFFINITINGSTAVPMVQLINAVKGFLGGDVRNYLVMLIGIALSITFTISRVQKDGPIAKFHAKDGWFTGALYYLCAIFSIITIFKIGPEQIHSNSMVGPEAIYLAGSVLLTVTIAGWLVTFLTEFGILEFIGTLMEPIMRPLFKVPGQSAVDALSSFVAAPAVGVFITNKLYNRGIYTRKEACCIATNFSVCSLGFFALLCSTAEVEYMYGTVILSSLLIVFILAAIVIRIPPLSLKKNEYFNGMEQTPEMRKYKKDENGIVKKALGASTTKVSGTPFDVFIKAIPDVLSFALKIVTFVMSIAVISLWLSEYTPLFDWIGMPMIPYLNLVQMPDAAAIAPACLVGIAEIFLPVLTIAGMEIAPMSIFFVIVLSTVQIIFFTESANAMMQSDMGLKFPELVLIFLIRTIIAIPIVSVFAHIFYG